MEKIANLTKTKITSRVDDKYYNQLSKHYILYEYSAASVATMELWKSNPKSQQQQTRMEQNDLPQSMIANL